MRSLKRKKKIMRGIKIDFQEKGKTMRGRGKYGPFCYFEFFALLMQFCLLEKATFSNENVREAEVFLNQKIKYLI